MIVESLIEHEDGSATLQIDMSAEEVRLILESAFRIGLIRGLKMAEEADMKEWMDERTDAAKRVTEWVGLTQMDRDTLRQMWAETNSLTDEQDVANVVETWLKEKNT